MSLSEESRPPEPHQRQDRSVDALDRLVRSADADTRTWQLPPASLAALRRPAVGLVVAGLVVVAVLVLTQRRPPAVDDRLPRAVASSTTTLAGAPPSAPGDTGGPSTLAPDARIVVHVAGAVGTPGVVELPGSSRVVDAVHAAGGLRADADPDRVNLAAPVADGHRVVIPVIGQPSPSELVAPDAPAGTGGSGPPDPADPSNGAPGGLIDLNTADAAALDELPGVGPSTAAAIIAHREKEGPFTSVDALLDVRGIGEAKLEALRDLVTVG